MNDHPLAPSTTVADLRDDSPTGNAGGTAEPGIVEAPRDDPARVDVAVVGGGLAGLALAFELRRRRPDLELLLLEATDRLGGKVLTERVERDGGSFLVEGGPDSLLTQKPWGRKLVHALGLEGELVPINRPAHPVSILRSGRLLDLPDGVALIAPTRLAPFVRSPVLSPLGKLRVALDLVLPPRQDDADESLGAFVRRRLGRQALERLAEPLVAGIYSADPDRLSLRATFPQFAALEREHRGVIRGLRASRRAAPTNGARPTFIALRNGMQTLTDALAAQVDPVTRRNFPIDQVVRSAGGAYSLMAPDRPPIVARRVALAVPAAVAARLTNSLAPDAAAALAQLRATSTGTVSLAYPMSAIGRSLPGYGLVIPRAERRPINAITLASAKFPGRAPAGWSLLRVFFGGARSPETFAADDDELLRIVRAELRSLLGIEQPPAFHRIYRWPDASPQYDVGHLDLIARIEAALPDGLCLTGSPYHGVGIPDIARAAAATAERILIRCTEEAPR